MALSICFVCLGNICRSPTAEGIMQSLVQDQGLQHLVEIDSAGTSAVHAGERADSRSRATASQRGIELTSISRQFEATDFERFDYVIAMDRSNERNLQRMARTEAQRERIHLLRSFDPSSGDDLDVPDPYYHDRFGYVFDVCQAGCEGLLDHLRTAGQLPTKQ